MQKFTTWIAAAAAAALISGIAVIASTPSHADAVSYIGPVHAGNSASQCLDVANAFGHGTSGLKLQTWTCGVLRSEDQVFAFDGNQGFLEYAGVSGATECVVPSGSAPYNTLELGSCPDAAYVTMRRITDGIQFVFGDAKTGPVLDIKGNGTASGSVAGIFGANGGMNQVWHTLQNPGVAAG